MGMVAITMPRLNLLTNLSGAGNSLRRTKTRFCRRKKGDFTLLFQIFEGFR
jgi:hypothetical protein